MKCTAVLALVLLQLVFARSEDPEDLRTIIASDVKPRFWPTLLQTDDPTNPMHRISKAEDWTNVCRESLTMTFPARARNTQGQWKVLVQMDSEILQPFHQVSCSINSSLINLPKEIHCKPKNVTVKLLTYDETKLALATDTFSIHLACDVYIA